MKPGLYANIHAKQERIAHGSKEKMRKPGSKGAPTAEAFREYAKTAKKKDGGVSLAAPCSTPVHTRPFMSQSASKP